MAAAVRLEDQFRCAICLEVFTEPVSTPCGHNFCKSCINQHWDTTAPCRCPLCNKKFNSRPDLNVNTLLSEMVSQFKIEIQSSSMLKCSKLEKKSRSMKKLKQKTFTECFLFTFFIFVVFFESQHIVEKIKENQRVVELSQRAADRETAAGLQVFSALMQSVQRRLDQFLEEVQEKQRQTQKQAQDLVQELKQEISKLKKTLSTEIIKLTSRLEMKRVQHFAVDITLDPDTAQPDLVLSEDLKQVHDTDVKKDLQDIPQRFSYCVCVLGKQSFSSGRFYFEVQVKEKTAWTLGVAQESINRNGLITLSPKNGFWSITLRNRDEYIAGADPHVPLSLKCPPQKVGVFVDYSEGLVSFYDVDSADLIYSFTGCRFRNKLLPYVSPSPNKGGTNSAPLVLTEV